LLMIYFNEIFSKNYLFNPNPGELGGIFYILGICLGSIAISIILWFLLTKIESKRSIYKKLKIKIFNPLFYLPIIGLFLIFFQWQQLPYLSFRIFMLLWIVGAILWAVFVILYILIRFPRQMREFSETEQLNKYLPRSKGMENKRMI
jgi:hypothetical protein